MFEFLGRGRQKSAKLVTDPGPSTMPQMGPLNATQREMVRFALHNVFRRHGIPAHWISGEVVPVHIPGQGEALILQLEVQKWHDALVLHAPALQHALLEELQRFGPDADPAHYLLTWKFSPDCECPHTRLPEPAFWNALAQAAPATAVTAPPSPVSPDAPVKAPFNLAPTALDDDDDDHGFAPTQIHDSRR